MVVCCVQTIWQYRIEVVNPQGIRAPCHESVGGNGMVVLNQDSWCPFPDLGVGAYTFSAELDISYVDELGEAITSATAECTFSVQKRNLTVNIGRGGGNHILAQSAATDIELDAGSGSFDPDSIYNAAPDVLYDANDRRSIDEGYLWEWHCVRCDAANQSLAQCHGLNSSSIDVPTTAFEAGCYLFSAVMIDQLHEAHYSGQQRRASDSVFVHILDSNSMAAALPDGGEWIEFQIENGNPWGSDLDNFGVGQQLRLIGPSEYDTARWFGFHFTAYPSLSVLQSIIDDLESFIAAHSASSIADIVASAVSAGMHSELILETAALAESSVYVFIEEIYRDDAAYGFSYVVVRTRANLQIQGIDVFFDDDLQLTATAAAFEDALTVEVRMHDPNPSHLRSNAYSFEFHYRLDPLCSADSAANSTAAESEEELPLFIPLGSTDSKRIHGVIMGGPGCVDIRVCVEDQIYFNQKTCGLREDFVTAASPNTTACVLQQLLSGIVNRTSVRFWSNLITFTEAVAVIMTEADGDSQADTECVSEFNDYVLDLFMLQNQSDSRSDNDTRNVMDIGSLTALIQSATNIINAQQHCATTESVGAVVEDAVSSAAAYDLLVGFNRFDPLFKTAVLLLLDAAHQTAECGFGVDVDRRRLAVDEPTSAESAAVSMRIAASTMQIVGDLMENYVDQMSLCEVEYLGDIQRRGILSMAVPVDLHDDQCRSRQIRDSAQSVVFGTNTDSMSDSNGTAAVQQIDARIMATADALYDALYSIEGNPNVMKLAVSIVTVTSGGPKSEFQGIWVNITFGVDSMDYGAVNARYSKFGLSFGAADRPRNFECAAYSVVGALWSNEHCLTELVPVEGAGEGTESQSEIRCHCDIAAIADSGQSVNGGIFSVVNIEMDFVFWNPAQSAFGVLLSVLLVAAYCAVMAATVHLVAEQTLNRGQTGTAMPWHAAFGILSFCILAVVSAVVLDQQFVGEVVRGGTFPEYVARSECFQFLGVQCADSQFAAEMLYFEGISWIYWLVVYHWTLVVDDRIIVDVDHQQKRGIFSRIRTLIVALNVLSTVGFIATMIAVVLTLQSEHSEATVELIRTALTAVIAVHSVFGGSMLFWFRRHCDRIAQIAALRASAKRKKAVIGADGGGDDIEEIPLYLVMRLKCIGLVVPSWFILNGLCVVLILWEYDGLYFQSELAWFTLLHFGHVLVATLWLNLFRPHFKWYLLFCLDPLTRPRDDDLLETEGVEKQGDLQMMVEAANREQAASASALAEVDDLDQFENLDVPRRDSLGIDLNQIRSSYDESRFSEFSQGIQDVVPSMSIKTMPSNTGSTMIGTKRSTSPKEMKQIIDAIKEREDSPPLL